VEEAIVDEVVRRKAQRALKVEKSTEKPAAGWTQDPEGVRRNIVAVATAEFAAKGFNGARVDEIAAKTSTSKRMIYYYFGDKEGLFVAVLEEAYARIRGIERDLDLAGIAPDAALRELTGFTFDYQNANPDFVRLVMDENIHDGVHLDLSQRIRSVNASALTALSDVYRRGVEEGIFRADLEVVDLHMIISAMCFFNVSNRATFSRIFGVDVSRPPVLAHRRDVVIDAVMRYALRKPKKRGAT
jgi:AcrR family transcriptional regulator